MSYSNIQRVRILYKTILKLHRGLPEELRYLGTNYVKDEFKKHKKCTLEEAEVFMKEWTAYAVTLAKQLGLKGPQTGSRIGSQLSDKDFDKFRDEQLIQLYELMEATKEVKEPHR